ncbi:hypothetical protein B0187_08705 [Haemophilus paracuniculus]|uniref:Uncharacterized protein n=1 Tax=Haemophilus paracuniculus TaxID=734 RepID=A0A1T0AQM9_9PAST|nr:hypothetical protein [Haemophilus paracuniculus]OOR98339.1 hypothetical protein B0187_08705 [Haemophilus paracuniculus]
MKKMIIALLAMGVFSAANAEIYKITTFTKAQVKKLQAEIDEGSGDSAVFSTNKGELWVYVEAPALSVLNKSKAGECYNITGDFEEMKAKKVKCPSANATKQATKKKIKAGKRP